MASKQDNPTRVFDFTFILPKKLIEYLMIKDPFETNDKFKRFIDSVESIFTEDLDARGYCFQLERGEESKLYHLQGRLRLKERTRTTAIVKIIINAKKDFYEDEETVRGLLFGMHLSKTSCENIKNDFYVTKKHTRIEGPWMFPPQEEALQAFIPRQFRLTPNRPFQEKIIEITKKFDDRSINVIINFGGNVGKSTLTGHLMTSRDDCIFLPPLNDFKDISQFICAIVKTQGRKRVGNIFIDFPRSIRQDKVYSFFAGIESLKNGIVFDTRYTASIVTFDSPNIFIFMNTIPELSYVSMDRWKFFAISKELALIKIKTSHQTTNAELTAKVKEIEFGITPEVITTGPVIDNERSWREHSCGGIRPTFKEETKMEEDIEVEF